MGFETDSHINSPAQAKQLKSSWIIDKIWIIMKSVLMSVAEITEKRLQHTEALLTSALRGLRIQEEIYENHKVSE